MTSRSRDPKAADGFVVFDVNKGVVHQSAGIGEAKDAARYFARRDREPAFGLDVTHARGPAIRPNPPPLAKAGLRPLDPAVVFAGGEEASLARAYEVLHQYFPRQSGRGYAPYVPGTTKTIRAIATEGILKQNAKLEKTAVNKDLGELAAVAYGLSLIPARMGFDLVDSNREPILPGVAGNTKKYDWREASAFAANLRPKRAFDLCSFATDECRRSCLVKTGQNDAVKNYSKLLMTYALENHPAEFTRLLILALDTYFVEGPADKVKFVRLNVYSDIIWEEFAPWMYERYAELGRFYDYTKIPQRIGRTPRNYDLTFSYSGTDANFKQCLSFLNARATRVAAVFMRGKKEWKEKIFPPGKRMAYSYMGFPLVDGDRHDFRPYDPPGVWVALRWKSPKGFNVTEEEASAVRAARGHGGKVAPVEVVKKFVVKAKWEGGEWIAPVQPNKTASVSVS